MAAGGAHVDLYAVLGVTVEVSSQEISKAYRRLALRNHPDKVPPAARAEASERFRQIARAYEVLRDDARRRCYDQTGVYDGHVAGDVSGSASEYDTFVNNFFGDEARGSDGRSADYTYYSLSNYDHLTLKEDDLPEYMKDICKVGLNYLTRVVEDLSERDVVFLRHQRVDILYVMVAYYAPLTQKNFDDGYIIHYYDNPLQAAISPAWSDQNSLGGGGGCKRVSAEVRQQRALTADQFKRRQDLARAAIGPGDPQAALEEKYAAAAQHQVAPGLAGAAPGDEAAPAARPARRRAERTPCCLPLHRWYAWQAEQAPAVSVAA